MTVFRCVIYGEPASAKNQRQIVKIRGVPRLIKSKKALAYGKEFDRQCPVLDEKFDGDVSVKAHVYYKSRRPDLACMDLIMDLLQGKVYLNDRQVKATMSLWNLDKENPRTLIEVKSIDTETSSGVSSLRASEIWEDLDHMKTEPKS